MPSSAWGKAKVTCTRPSLAVASAPAITIVGKVDAGQMTSLSNTGSVTWATSDLDHTNYSDTRALPSFPTRRSSDLKSDSPDPVIAGNNLTYTLSVSNAGPSNAASLSVTDTLPAGTSFVSASGTGWTCTGTATVTCTRASLAVASAPDITVVVTVSPAQ